MSRASTREIRRLRAQVEQLNQRANELWDALDRVRHFKHHEACSRLDGCSCWELELHVLMPVLRNEAVSSTTKEQG